MSPLQEASHGECYAKMKMRRAGPKVQWGALQHYCHRSLAHALEQASGTISW